MAYLFEITGNIVYPYAETLLLSPFKEIWNRDKSKKKEYALEEFAYIEFMASVRKTNPFNSYSKDIRDFKIRERIITKKNWSPDKLVKEGIENIILFQKEASISYNYYMSAKKAAEKLQNFFNNFSITQLNEKTGNPIYKPRDITVALNDTERVLTNLKNLEVKVEEELFEKTKNKGDKIVSFFAKTENFE